MSDIQIFKNPVFGEIRVTGSSDKPMFCLTDVCKALDIKNVSGCKSRLNPKGVGTTDTLTNGGVQKMTYIDEGNLYKCIFQSRKAEANQFQDWVTDDVLPSIRKHGGYLTTEKIDEVLSDPDTIIRLATSLKEERQKRLDAERSADERQKQIEEQRPKVAFAEAITSSKTSCLVGELAKLIKQSVERTGKKIAIGQNRFYEWLRNNGFLGKSNNYYNVANQEYIEQGLFELKKSVHDENGVLVTKTTTKVTGKGQQYFINGFLSGKFNIL